MSFRGTDYFAISRGGVDYRTSGADVLAYILANGGGSGGGGSTAWGAITGTLSSQADLSSALAGKQPLATVLTNTTAAFTTAQETKLAGIASGATANVGTVTSVGGTGTVSGLTLTGTVTASGNLTLGGTLAVATTNIANDAVTYAKVQNVAAASRLLGRGSAGGSGDMEEITLGTNLSMSGTTLNAAGGGGGGIADGDYGDITVSGSATVFTIDNDVVSNAKLANVATATIKGRVTASTGDPEDLTGTQATTLLDTATTSLKGLLSAADKTKLDGIATSATANSSDATLLARANHTGTQAISTVTGLQAALDAKQALITVSTTAPSSPVTGQLWVDTN